LVLTNPHSYPKYRVNNVVANSPEFRRAFGAAKDRKWCTSPRAASGDSRRSSRVDVATHAVVVTGSLALSMGAWERGGGFAAVNGLSLLAQFARRFFFIVPPFWEPILVPASPHLVTRAALTILFD